MFSSFVLSKNYKFQILEPLSTKRFTKDSNLNGVLYLISKQPLFRQLGEVGVFKEKAGIHKNVLDFKKIKVQIGIL